MTPTDPPPSMFSGAESDKCIFDQFAIIENEELEDCAEIEDAVEIDSEGTLVDFPRAWNEPEEDETPPLLIRVPRGYRFRCGLPSYELSTSSRSQWQLLSPDFIFPGITTEFSGFFDGISTSGGLVLIPCYQASLQERHSLESPMNLSFIVSNPMERSCRTLPPMIDLCKELTSRRYMELNMPLPQAMGIFMDPATGFYYIPVIQRLTYAEVVAMQVYESNTGEWRIFGQWRLWDPQFTNILEVAYAEGKFFFLVHDLCRGLYQILFLEDSEWQAIGLLPEGYSLFKPTIFEQSGFLMLGGFVPKEQVMREEEEQCVLGATTEELMFGYIWYHNSAEMRWHFYCKPPLYWSHDLHQRSPGSSNYCTLQISAGGGYICVASSNGKVASYDTAQGEWSWLTEADGDCDDKILILEGKRSLLGTSAS